MSWCKWTIPKKTYSTGRVDEAHPCPFTATDNGYCLRHQPDAMRRTLQTRITTAQAQLAELERHLVAIKAKGGA